MRRRRFRIIAYDQLTAEQLDTLRGDLHYLALGDLVPPDEVPAALQRYAPGRRYGLHREVILRREVRRGGIPTWFDPMRFVGHHGITTPDGYSCFLETKLDRVSRAQPSTFETRILSIEDEPVPDQPSLLREYQ